MMTRTEKALAGAMRECYAACARWPDALAALDSLLDTILASLRPSIREEFASLIHD